MPGASTRARRAALAASVGGVLLGAGCSTTTPPGPGSGATPEPAAVADSSPVREPRSPAAFEAWRQRHAPDVDAFEAFLAGHGLLAQVPLHELLRSASSWQGCQAEPYAVPPATQWPSVLTVLRLLRGLQAEGALAAYEVHSGYRNPALNACAGGAARSAHLLAFAVDLTPQRPADALARVCTFWLQRGEGLRMGLGLYPNGRLHLDTLGYRSWGADGRSASSPCRAGPAAAG